MSMVLIRAFGLVSSTGEVINFVKDALNQMAADGISVLVEGRAQTLNYIRTPHRFELVLGDELLIGTLLSAGVRFCCLRATVAFSCLLTSCSLFLSGKRRAAQKMMAAAIKV